VLPAPKTASNAFTSRSHMQAVPTQRMYIVRPDNRLCNLNDVVDVGLDFGDIRGHRRMGEGLLDWPYEDGFDDYASVA
jgi:hypothetical protein